MPAVSETKIGAASIGLMTEKSDENASTTNFASADENMRASIGVRSEFFGVRSVTTRRPDPTGN